MGNNRSQQQQQQQQQPQASSSAGSRSLCLLYLIRRSWRMVGLSAVAKGADDTDDDCASDLSSSASRCSGCKGCAYHRELTFDSSGEEESSADIMAPNAEEDLLVTTMPRAAGTPHTTKERLRPPTYNAEDYAIALRRWGRRALGGHQQEHGNDNQNTLPSTCTSSSSSGYASGNNGSNSNNAGEMTLRQFTSVSELLNKLRADLRLAFPSFVQEFASAPADGISLLLETLRGVQLSQSQPAGGGGTNPGPRRPRARRAALDELGCVECLAACVDRCPDATRILAQAQPGLLALAVCLTSSLNRSRVLALQLLTKVCQTQGCGYAAASEAVSTLRLRYGEGGRFRFLAGALLAAKAALPLRLAGLSFLNAFIASAPRTQTKLYIQAEACEAGLEPRVLQDWLKYADAEDPLSAQLRDEVRKWSRHCVDVEQLQGRARRAEETCRLLGKKVAALQQQLHKLQLERLNEYNSRQQQQQQQSSSVACAVGVERARNAHEKKVSSSAEDEGISFSERSSSPDDRPARAARAANNDNSSVDNDQETTIDDVIEELRIIVKDAEDELHDWSQLQQCSPAKTSKSELLGDKKPSKARECLRSTEESARLDRDAKCSQVGGPLKIVVPGPPPHGAEEEEEEDDDDGESAIVPAIIHPQPPRRAPACLVGDPLFPQQEPNVVNDEDLALLLDDEDDGSDSLLSASRLNYQRQVTPKAQLRHRQEFGRRSGGSAGEFKIEAPADFEISETILDGRAPRQLPSAITSDTRNAQYSKCSNTVQRRTERRKYLRRCQSQDHIEQQQQQQQQQYEAKNRPRVVEHIRKFESLNSFDERRSLPSIEDSRLRRSESFHQTRLSSKEYNSSSSRGGGSDNGLLLYSVVVDHHHQQQQQQQQQQGNNITKSLDRIDEGLDAMVDIVLGNERRRMMLGYQHRRSEESVQQQQREDRKYTSFLESKPTQRPQPRDHSRIFAGRPHDVLGIGKNRFNAGKYSGNNPQQQQQQQQYAPKSHHRQLSPPRHARGKVTDMLSGLY